MHHLWCWISANAEAITAVAAFIAALFTAFYLFATILIFLETKKSANAAQKSADAADKSADAAQQSIALVRKQIEEQTIRSQTAVRTGVNIALKTIQVWRAKAGDLANMNNLKSLPPTDNLILPHTLVESLALIDVKEAMKLSNALSEMSLARDAIESTRNVDNKDGRNSGHFGRAGEEVAKRLDSAADLLHELLLFLEMQVG